MKRRRLRVGLVLHEEISKHRKADSKSSIKLENNSNDHNALLKLNQSKPPHPLKA